MAEAHTKKTVTKPPSANSRVDYSGRPTEGTESDMPVFIRLHDLADGTSWEFGPLLREAPFKPTGCCSRFESEARLAAAAVVFLPSVRTADQQVWLKSLIQGTPGRCWILLTAFQPSEVRKLIDLNFGVKVVWLHEGAEVFLRAVGQRHEENPLARIARQIKRIPLDPQFVRSLTKTCLMRRPPRTIDGMARLGNLSREQLRYRWRKFVGSEFRLMEFLDSVFLLRSLEARSRGQSWHAVSRTMTVDIKTINRMRRSLLKDRGSPAPNDLRWRLVGNLERFLCGLGKRKAQPSSQGDGRVMRDLQDHSYG